MFLGRPGSMKASHLSLPRLCSLSSEHDTQLMSAWFGLSTHMAKMVSSLNRPLLNDGKSLLSLRKLDMSLKEWHASLPPEFRFTNESLAPKKSHVCVLHMQFFSAQILLHRSVAQNFERLLPAGCVEADMRKIWPYTAEVSQKIVHDNAINVARALEISRLAFEDSGFATLMLDVIFTAASSLIKCMTLPGSSTTALRDHKWLMCFLEACESLQVHYPVVGRMLGVLNSLLVTTGLSKYIWRGSTSAPSLPPSIMHNPSSTANLPASPSHLNNFSARSVPFELKRWCEDSRIIPPSLPSPPRTIDGDTALAGTMETVRECRNEELSSDNARNSWTSFPFSPLASYDSNPFAEYRGHT